MKCTIPEISWHNRDPVLSVDVQPKCSTNQDFERLATGGTDSHVLIWHIKVQDNGAAEVVFAADLTRHQKAVNVVRFSPSGEFLASGDDESAIIVWKQKTDLDSPEFPAMDSDGNSEQWLTVKVLRGHVEDVYDLAWSPDSGGLVSGSVDNTAILWDVKKGVKTGILADHKGFVQGVAWDPTHRLVATLASDRVCRVYSTATKKAVCRMSKAVLPVPEDSPLDGVAVRLFHDDTFKSFFRRLTFSPDGQLLITPSGVIEDPTSGGLCNATYIFTRQALTRPSVYLPSRDQFTIAVKCCPLLFELRTGDCTMFDLPYRMIMAVAEQKSVVLYDTQQSAPFAIISNIHYTRLTDLAWSSDGCLLVISSTDGYCSFVTFAPGELGVVYKPSTVATSNSTPSTKPCPVATSNSTPNEKSDTMLPTLTSDNDKVLPTSSNKTSIEKPDRRKSNKAPVKRIQPNAVGATVVAKACSKVLSVVKADVSVDKTSDKEDVSFEKKEDKKEDSVLDDDVKMMDDASEVKSAPEVISERATQIEAMSPTRPVTTEAMSPTRPVTAEAGSPQRQQMKTPSTPVTPLQKTPRRVAFVTISSPKSKKKLL